MTDPIEKTNPDIQEKPKNINDQLISEILMQFANGSLRHKLKLEQGDIRSSNYIADSQGWRITPQTIELLTRALKIVNADIDAAADIAISKTALGTYTPWDDWTPTYGASGSMTWGTITTYYARWQQVGKAVDFYIKALGTTADTASSALTFTLPVAPKNTAGVVIYGYTRNSATYSSAHGENADSVIYVFQYDESNFGIGAARGFAVAGRYEVA